MRPRLGWLRSPRVENDPAWHENINTKQTHIGEPEWYLFQSSPRLVLQAKVFNYSYK